MTALTADRTTPRMIGDDRSGPMAAGVTIFAGAIVMRAATGHLTKGQTAAGLIGVGRAEEQKVNAGAAGAADVKYRAGIYRFANSAAADLISAADIGGPAYAVDDQTVAKTSATNTRSIAGFVDGVDELGVWVRFDEALARAYLT